MIAGKGLGGWFGVRSESVEAGSPLERVVFTSLLLLGLTILWKRRFNWYSAIKDNSWLMVLLCYMFFSIVWSDQPYISLKRSLKELVAVVMAFVILSEADPRNAVSSVLKRSIYVFIPLSLLLVMYFPDIGTDGVPGADDFCWIGVTSGKNGLGRLCLVSALFLVWSLVRRWQGRDVPLPRYQLYIDMLVLGIVFFLMKGPAGAPLTRAISATAIITLTMGLVVFFGLLYMKKIKKTIGVNALRAIIVASIVLGTAPVFVGELVVGGSATTIVGREEGLTGRGVMWARLLDRAMTEPILGHAIGGFWTDAIVERFHCYTAHNGYLDILLNYGFVGLLLFSMFLLSSCRKAHKELSYDYHWGSLWICFLLVALIYNVAESSLESFTNHLTAIIVFLSVSSSATPNDLSGFNKSTLVRASSYET